MKLRIVLDTNNVASGLKSAKGVSYYLLSLSKKDSIHQTIKKLTMKDGTSINQFIALAASEKISAFLTEAYLNQRAKKASWKKFDRVMKKVSHGEPDEQDQF